REREQDVSQPLDHKVGEPALETGDRSEGDADQEAEADGEEADREREPAAVEEPSEDVTPEVIRPERVSQGKGPEGLRQALSLRVVRGQKRRGGGQDEQGNEQSQPHHGGPVAAEALPAFPESTQRGAARGCRLEECTLTRSGFEGR